ncbi:MAG: RluA family pseudouridine synthase [Croceimicrobium sp.]
MGLSDRILFEDNHLLILNKLAGELVQGDHTKDKPLLEMARDYIKERYNKPGNVFCGLVHRLDRPTSGIVVFAKTSKALTRMNKIFEQREVSKVYYAVVQNKPANSEERLVHYLRKDAKKNKSFVRPESDKSAKKAELLFRLKAASQKYFLLEVELYTGRHHQIRAQLSAIGSPIKGDLKYGFARSNHDASISLHAGRISFKHPVGDELITIKAANPGEDAIWRIFNPKILE